MKKPSMKKTLGAVGTITAFALATVQAFRINTHEALNTALMWICILTAALLALKLGTGIVNAVSTIKQAEANNEP